MPNRKKSNISRKLPPVTRTTVAIWDHRVGAGGARSDIEGSIAQGVDHRPGGAHRGNLLPRGAAEHRDPRAPGSPGLPGDTPGVIDRVARLLERPLVIREPFAALDAIVVLGAPLGPGGTLSAVASERVAAAAALWRAGGGGIVVATGGITRGAPRAEADAIAEALGALGVPVAI